MGCDQAGVDLDRGGAGWETKDEGSGGGRGEVVDAFWLLLGGGEGESRGETD